MTHLEQNTLRIHRQSKTQIMQIGWKRDYNGEGKQSQQAGQRKQTQQIPTDKTHMRKQRRHRQRQLRADTENNTQSKTDAQRTILTSTDKTNKTRHTKHTMPQNSKTTAHRDKETEAETTTQKNRNNYMTTRAISM